MDTGEQFVVFGPHALILVGKILYFNLEIFHQLKVNHILVDDDDDNMTRSLPVSVVCVTARLIHDF